MITPTPEDEAALDATKAPLMEHLLELRKRLIWAALSFALCFVICFAFATPIFNFLIRPLHATTNHLIYTALTEVFFTQVKIGMFGGICLGFPAIAAQIWLFVAPGLYKHEKNAFLPFLLWTAGDVHHGRVVRVFRDAALFDPLLWQLPGAHHRHAYGDRAAGQGQRVSRLGDDADLRLWIDLPIAGAAVAFGQGRHRHRQGAEGHAPLRLCRAVRHRGGVHPRPTPSRCCAWRSRWWRSTRFRSSA